MDVEECGRGPVIDMVRIGGGTQNLMYRFARGDKEYVLRRGPRHLRTKSNEAIAREVRILRALTHTEVPHPRLIAAPDNAVIADAAFYLMEPVDGVNVVAELAEAHRSSTEVRRRMGFEMIEALTSIAAVDYRATELTTLGRPDGFHERQAERWWRDLLSYGSYEGREPLHHAEQVATWIANNLPRSWEPGLMHGDFHLGNVMFAFDGPGVVAVVDWELCTIGDPLLDLGWIIALWWDGGDGDLMDSALAAAGGLATVDEMIEHYAQNSSRDLSHITWYGVLACFKLAVILEGTYVRSLTGAADRGLGLWMHERYCRLIDHAHRLIADSTRSARR
ncbi:phosphotransferase family protein [Rhodococcus opacus]|uniref:Phosphotransferase family protein n=2 Tax=Rhodococcus opacus TaxID=37919 RepID=A0A2S8IZ97_RHOOP|nr:phosphotransferase family protein [Rhodococcus opacus]